MTKKALKLVCILILILSTLITSKNYAATKYPKYSYKGDDGKHYVSEDGRYAYSEKGDEIIAKERSIYTWSW